MIDFENKTDCKIEVDDLEKIRESLAHAKSLELIIVNDEEMRGINLEYRKLDKPTDVLSFPIKVSKTEFIGSIIISANTAKRVADEMGHAFEVELKILFIHGLLHLLGFDHESDNGQMLQKEISVAKMFGIEETLLSR
ncbi:MAG TPA: rRNA maturation RNase YbeY [Campylobacterales bacterium]|nr:rRNA maturation RNase YbeY [Campylobacterales bacterium]